MKAKNREPQVRKVHLETSGDQVIIALTFLDGVTVRRVEPYHNEFRAQEVARRLKNEPLPALFERVARRKVT